MASFADYATAVALLCIPVLAFLVMGFTFSGPVGYVERAVRTAGLMLFALSAGCLLLIPFAIGGWFAVNVLGVVDVFHTAVPGGVVRFEVEPGDSIKGLNYPLGAHFIPHSEGQLDAKDRWRVSYSGVDSESVADPGPGRYPWGTEIDILRRPGGTFPFNRMMVIQGEILVPDAQALIGRTIGGTLTINVVYPVAETTGFSDVKRAFSFPYTIAIVRPTPVRNWLVKLNELTGMAFFGLFWVIIFALGGIFLCAYGTSGTTIVRRRWHRKTDAHAAERSV